MPQSNYSFQKQMDKVIKDLTADILATIGKPSRLPETQRIEFITQVIPQLLQALEDSGYKSAYEAELKDASDKLKQYHKISKIPFSFTATDKNTLKALKVMDLNKFNGLGESAINNLYLQLKSLILTGASDKDYLAAVSKSIDEGLGKYAVTYANTSRAIYYQTAEDLMANELRNANEPVYWEYVGPADSKNRDECVWALDKTMFTDEERSEFEAEYGVRYNCRHTFMMVTEDDYKNGQMQYQDTTDKEKQRREQVLQLFSDK